MGTNYYWKDPPAFAEQMGWDVTHIGKTSAAGYFCFDCGVPLIEGDVKYLHHSGMVTPLDHCPKCEKPRPKTLQLSMVGNQHFSKAYTDLPVGVQACCSFSWAQEPDFVGQLCKSNKEEPLIEDEYGCPMTGQEFLDMLYRICPIQYTHSIGEHNWS